MMRQALPFLARALGEIAQDYALVVVRRNILNNPTIGLSRVRRGESPTEPHGCPYCAVTRQLAITHRYLTAAGGNAATAPTYIKLAAACVEEALKVLDAMTGEPDIATLNLMQGVQQLQLDLAHTDAAQHLEEIAASSWRLSDLSLRLAERLNRPAAPTPLPPDAIEGEFRVVGE